MSTFNPGCLYDATSSWNGYNHQGKIAIWYAIHKINNLYDTSLSTSDNKTNLSEYFIEIEHLEDFSFGRKVNGKREYLSVHQVKNHSADKISHYDTALLGLVQHIADTSTIEEAFLHTTLSVRLGTQPLPEHIKSLSTAPTHLVQEEKLIATDRLDATKRKDLTTKKPGRPTNYQLGLLTALKNKHGNFTALDDKNLDLAFDARLEEIADLKRKFQTISATNLSKVCLFSYPINGTMQPFCGVDQIKALLQSEISKFFSLTDPTGYKRSDSAFINSCYLYILGKLDQHVIERDLHYNLYKANQLDREICLSEVLEWLISDEITQHGEPFYLHSIKEHLFHKAEEYCDQCDKKGLLCSSCAVIKCMDKIGHMDFKTLKRFIHITNPQFPGSIDKAYVNIAGSSGIRNPFLKGLRDIDLPYSFDDLAIAYLKSCALSTITKMGFDNDDAHICSQIIRNRNIYSLLMDYDCLISNDIDIVSIQDLSPKQSHIQSQDEENHIAHCKNVRITPLSKFISQNKP